MEILICDAICGAGKTSAMINMMNEKKDERFMFVTKYLTEVERIKAACAEREFISPSSDNTSKICDIANLLRDGCNIATTHSLFTSYTDEIKQLIRDQHYTLVLDEVVDVATPARLSNDDFKLLADSGYLGFADDQCEWMNDSYNENDENNCFSEIASLCRSRNLVKDDDVLFFWMIPAELFSCFSKAYILTYMFYDQPLRCFFDMNGMTYSYIGVRCVDGKYELCDVSLMDRSRDLSKLVHILDHKKANAIGSKRNDLSYSWYNAPGKFEDRRDAVRRSVVNVMRNVYGVKCDQALWTVFKEYEYAISPRGYMASFLPFNKRASNEYADKTHLAYCVNNFPRPWEVNYFRKHGVEINGDMYALSILVQWLFRSAIRNGGEVWLYVPSARMRWLLQEWMKNLQAGDDLRPLHYETKFTSVPSKTKRKGVRKNEGSRKSVQQVHMA